MANTDLLNTPLLWINKYLQSKLSESLGYVTPFFPPSPFNLDDLTEKWMILNNVNTPVSNGVACTWDRLIKMQKNKFPHIKNEQILYYFYGLGEDSIPTMIQTQEAVLRLLDRGDESAEELNAWCANRKVQLDDGTTVDNMFLFHSFKVYQLEETRDIIDFGTARTYGGNKIIIDFEYHQAPGPITPGLSNQDQMLYSDWTPEARLSDANKIVI
jgi:hypothetical protein